MKHSIILLQVCFLTLIGYTSLLSQDSSAIKLNRIKVNDVHVQTGFHFQNMPEYSFDDLNALTPNSTLLKNNFSGYTQNGGNSTSGNTFFAANIGIKFLNKSKKIYKLTPIFRLGFTHMQAQNVHSNLYKETKKNYDTLISSQTGNQYILDSITRQSYNVTYNSKQIKLDASILFKSNPELRWCVFAGVGLSVGTSINANTQVYYYSYTQNNNMLNQNNNISQTTANNNLSENFKNKNSFGTSFYLPLGLDFRLGKKREFWKRLHLVYELRVGINTITIPELKSTISNTFFQHGLGLRVCIN